MNNSSTAQCPKCGATLTGAVLNGLCPDCLALVAFGSEPGNDKTAVPSGTDAASAAQTALASTVRYFGDYELQEEIARGGMGVVYRARQVSLNRTVAVKMILAGQFAGTAQRQRFQREAEAAAQLRHPNIVAIHEVGEHEGRSYFSMDFIEGRPLATVFREGKLPPGRAATLLKTLAEAVHYAHQRGTLHRDLKPNNVLISADGQPHILDFGLARPIEGGAELTRTGDVVGSPNYMPPEQAAGRGGDVGPASDVYALGAILYEAITGRVPFTGETVADVLMQVIKTEPAPPRRWNPNVPADLETICLKCLEKRPERRYHSAQALAEELERFLNFEPILARPAGSLRKTWSWSQQNPWVLAAGCGLLVLLLGCVAYGFWEKSRVLAGRLQIAAEAEADARFKWERQRSLVSRSQADKDAPLPQMQSPWRTSRLTTVTPSGQDALLPAGESPALLFLKLFPGVCFLLYFAGKTFRQVYRRRAESGASPAALHLLAHGGVGAVGTAIGMGYLLLQIRFWVRLTSLQPIFPLELVGVMCALILLWMAFRVVWEAVGMHETSRFRGTVDKALERQLADEARRWSVFKLVGFALWLLLLAWGLGCMGLLSFGSILSGGVSDVIIAVIGLLLSIGVAALLAWVVRKRLRLFTFVFAPLALAVFAFALGIVALNPKLIAGLFGCAVLSAILTLSGLFFFGGRDTSPAGEPRRFPVNPWLDALRGVALFIALLVLFHVVENWRGRREWARVKSELAAKGESLDYASFLKPPVADEENVMAHPYMKQHFVKGTAVFPVSHPPSDGRVMGNSPFSLADLRKLPRRSDPMPTVAGLVGDQASREIIPILAFTNQPLAEVFSELARAAGLRFRPGTNQWTWMAYQKRAMRHKLLTRTFTNSTALQALHELAKDHQLSPDPAEWRTARVLALTRADGPSSLQDVLDWYARDRGEFAQLEEALLRPQSRLSGDPRRLMETPIPNFASFHLAVQAYANLCMVHLLVGEAEAALSDLRTMRRLTEVAQAHEPAFLMVAILKVTLAGICAKTVEETLAAGMWPASHLEHVQGLCEGADVLPNVVRSLRGGERAALLQWMQALAREDRGLFCGLSIGNERSRGWPEKLIAAAIPEGWVDQNYANYARLIQLQLKGVDVGRQRLDARAIEDGGQRVSQVLNASQFYPVYSMARIAVPNLVKAYLTTAKCQTLLDQTYLACALERCRVAKGSYPPTLDALVPEYAAKLPHDLFDGQPLRYRRTDDGGYLLYSIGWNSKDDQGRASLDKNGKPEWQDEKGDWVWQSVPKL